MYVRRTAGNGKVGDDRKKISLDVKAGDRILTYVDMMQAGIIDPTKVERIALQNAASVASLLLTTEALINDLPEEKSAGAPPMPHGDF